MSKVSDVGKPVNRVPKLPGQCAISELLDQFGAVYSFNVPIYKLGLQIVMLRPIRCKCGSWFLVEVEPERRSSS